MKKFRELFQKDIDETVYGNLNNIERIFDEKIYNLQLENEKNMENIYKAVTNISEGFEKELQNGRVEFAGLKNKINIDFDKLNKLYLCIFHQNKKNLSFNSRISKNKSNFQGNKKTIKKQGKIKRK